MEFEHVLQLGIVQPSSSLWDWSPCGDYRALNGVSTPDRYERPILQGCTAMIIRLTVFSRIDLVKAYYQVPMKPADIPKTAVTTPFGLFEYILKSFGMCNAVQTFQCFIDQVFRGFLFRFADLVASADTEQHKTHLSRRFSTSARLRC